MNFKYLHTKCAINQVNVFWPDWYSCGHLCWTICNQCKALHGQNSWSVGLPLWRWLVRPWTLPTRWVPNGPTKGALQDQNLPSQHRQARSHLPWHPQEQVVSSLANQSCKSISAYIFHFSLLLINTLTIIGFALNPGSDVCSKLWWSLGRSNCRTLEEQRSWGHRES